MKKKQSTEVLSKQECNDCGEFIPSLRMKLIPKTKTCVTCQEDREKSGDFQRHRMDVKYVFKCDEIESTEETLVRGSA